MAEAKAKAKTEAKQEEKQPSQQVAAFNNVQTFLAENAGEFRARLPKHINSDRFEAVALEAVRQNPLLLKCTPRSLFNAFRKAAADGILPDGREGVITPYKDEAQWNPMIFGLRKRARELDDLIVDTQVVYANDHFVWHQGDDPKLEHTPAPLGHPSGRGNMIGAYAIYKRHGEILHREVMDVNQIKTVQSQSKKPDSLMWTKFPEEAWRKVVARRGFKSVPSLSEKLDAIVRSGDEEFEFPESQSSVLDRAKPERPRDVRDMLDRFSVKPEEAKKSEAKSFEEAEVIDSVRSNLRYDEKESAATLELLWGEVPRHSNEAGDFVGFIESWREQVAMMTPADQKKACEEVEQVACDNLGTSVAALLPRLI